MAVRNPRDASINVQQYDSPAIIACFESIWEPLLNELQQQQRDISFDAHALSQLTGQLQQFQHECLGIQNRPSNAPLRIPAKLFKVVAGTPLHQSGPLYAILLAAYTHRIANNWRKWDFSPQRKAKNAEMIHFIRDCLVRLGFITVPKIAFAESTSSSVRKALTSLAKKIQVPVVSNVNEATHILYGPLHQYDGAEEEWFRTLEKDGDQVLVHWWYYPDSYDSWLLQTDQFADPEEAPEHNGAWHIAGRWLQDSVKYNELMNEEDYEEVDSEEMAMDIDTNDRKMPQHEVQSDAMSVSSEMTSTPAEPNNTKVVEIVAPPVPVLNENHYPQVRIRDIERERPQLGSRQRKNEFEPYSNGDITNISQCTLEFIELPKSSKPSTSIKHENDGETDYQSLCRAQPYDYTTDMTPSWFDITTIHDIEKHALPEFFTGPAKKANEYKKCRDFMVNTYRENPSYYLTVTSCKVALSADLVTLVKIHSFLEFNGIINHQDDPRRKIFDPYIDSEPDAGIDTTGTQRDFNAESVSDIQCLRDLIYDTSKDKSNAKGLWDVRIEDDTNVDGKKVFTCCACHNDCSEVRYQSLKYKGVQTCIDCFLEGRFTSTTWSGEFIRVEATNDTEMMDDDWTDMEILRLLEGIERYDDDWLAVSEHVKSRSKEQCITQFLQLPIDEEFLTAKLSEKELEELPFGDLANPVMTLIAFLSGHINPGIGSIAAKTAIKELMRAGEQGDGERVFSRETVKKATVGALKSAVEQAQNLANYENQEIQHWTRLAVKTVVEKLTFKVKQYDELENSLENELKELEKQGVALTSSIEALHKQYPPSAAGSATVPTTGNATPNAVPNTSAPSLQS